MNEKNYNEQGKKIAEAIGDSIVNSGALDHLVDRGKAPDEDAVYIYNHYLAWRKNAPFFQQQTDVVSGKRRAHKVKVGEQDVGYEFEFIDEPGVTYTTNYAWSFVLDTPDNAAKLEQYNAGQQRICDERKRLHRLLRSISLQEDATSDEAKVPTEKAESKGSADFYFWWEDQDNGCPTLVLDNDEEFAIAVWNAAVASEKKRADQLSLNCGWLIEQIDKIHRALCPHRKGTWQTRALQAADAAAHVLKFAGWIPVSEQRPPLIEDSPETDGFFLLLRHDPRRDAVGKYRLHLWCGSAPSNAAYWARIPDIPPSGEGEISDADRMLWLLANARSIECVETVAGNIERFSVPATRESIDAEIKAKKNTNEA